MIPTELILHGCAFGPWSMDWFSRFGSELVAEYLVGSISCRKYFVRYISCQKYFLSKVFQNTWRCLGPIEYGLIWVSQSFVQYLEHGRSMDWFSRFKSIKVLCSIWDWNRWRNQLWRELPEKIQVLLKHWNAKTNLGKTLRYCQQKSIK